MTGPTTPRDPRHYQILVLAVLLAFGIIVLDFGVHWQNALTILVTAQLVQFAATRLAGLSRFDPLSALITSLSLTLLLRTDLALLAGAAAAVAVASKFVLRVHGKHVFNPANVALVAVTLASDRAWISTGQWGSAALGAFALACLGFLVLTRARRSETTIAFLLAYAALLCGRALWLGDPLAIPMHQLQNGALLLFAFFMISDPKTSPDSVIGRIGFAILVAINAFLIRFLFFEPNALIYALVLTAPLVPVIDVLLGGPSYHWKPAGARRGALHQGVKS